MRKREFNEIKKENPESKIWKRTRNYQDARNKLALVLSKWDEKNEKSARMNYLVEKAVSNETFSKKDYDFILWLEQVDLENFVSALRSKVRYYRYQILDMSEIHEDGPFDSDVDALFAWNKILRFISQTRNGVYSEPIRAIRTHTHVSIDKEGIKARTDDMKKLYPNWEEMVSANEADAKVKHEELKQNRKNTLIDPKRQDVFEKIYWDEDAIMEDLKENFVTIKDATKKINTWEKMEDIEWKEVHFELPAVWNFKWFKFDYFVSNNTTNAKVLKKNPKLERQLYSMKEIWNLLTALRNYMKECDVLLDWHSYINYAEEMKYWKTRDWKNEAWSCLNAILWLQHAYWLKNKILVWQENWRTIKFKPHVLLRCHKDGSYFDYSKDPLSSLYDIEEIIVNRLDWWMSWCCEGIDDAYLLMKLS